MYSKDNPKRVEAESVRRIDAVHVEVIYEGEALTGSRDWTGFFLEEDESYVLVRRGNGDWLRVCFRDKDVK